VTDVQATRAQLAVDAAMLIGGREVTGDERIDVVSPADTSRRVGSIPAGTVADVGAAVAAAGRAFRDWSHVPFAERAAILVQAAEALVPGEADRAILLAAESGHTLGEATGGVRACRGTLRYYADVAASFALVEELPTPTGRVIVSRDPMGVAVLIVPWNAPTTLAFLGLAPILLAGNTVVVKPPSEAPLALIEALAVIAPLFPPGTINVVTGRSETIGRALVTDPGVRKINFTGSTAAGKEIARLAADTLKRLSLELGGNDPAVVLADADLDDAVPELVRGTFALAGQMCYDVKRIYVEAPLYPEFVERFTAAADELVVGDGLDTGSTMGALISGTQRQRLDRLVTDARADGAHVEVVGRQLDADTWERGYFRLPAVVTGVDERSEIVHSEQFGPAIPIMSVSSVDEAIERANATDYGLASSVWSRDEERAFELAARLEAGTSFVNVHRLGASGVDMPYGGFKESGIGRSHGVVALEEQFELHTISSRRPG
jgi:aldehyde dehydrogenase